MKNLIEEIEKLRTTDKPINVPYTDGKNKGINECLKILNQYNIGELSDGYHTFNSLYEQRMYLFATIVNQNKDKSWKSHKHEDGELCFGGGWFIVGVDTPKGSYTYHYENKYWNLFECQELEYGKKWDGHTDKDVDRMLSLSQYNIITAPKSIKLSEIVKRMNERLKEHLMDSYMEILIKRDETKNFITLLYKDNSYKDPYPRPIFSFWNNESIGMPEHTNFKWLYALWIAGTEIIDDLKEDDK